MRGKLVTFFIRVLTNGLIPACAGKTRIRRAILCHGRAHPRVCGENVSPAKVASQLDGSSPRVRGKHTAALRLSGRCGLIPACAGKTRICGGDPPERGAHPRVCGENRVAGTPRGRLLGSSPRVRGKPSPGHRRRSMGRLIPACAGKTDHRRQPNGYRRAHPRVCGENLFSDGDSVRLQGSSPRVRGKRGLAAGEDSRSGLIPACAGKTSSETPATPQRRAHPRVCGENTERSGVLTLRSVRSWKTLSFPPSLKVTHCWTFMQLSLSRIRL